MPGRTWTNPDQAQFLKTYLPQYFDMHANGTLAAFWPCVDSEWFQKYPERDLWFPGNGELTVEEEVILRTKLDDRRKVSRIIMHHGVVNRPALDAPHMVPVEKQQYGAEKRKGHYPQYGDAKDPPIARYGSIFEDVLQEQIEGDRGGRDCRKVAQPDREISQDP